MRLEDYRKEKDLSYENLARELDMTTSKVYRICVRGENCIKLVDAHHIVQYTEGQVDYVDLLGDC